MSATELYECFQWVCAYSAGAGAVAMFAVAIWMSPLGKSLRSVASDVWIRFRRLGAFGQVVVAVGIAICVQRGSAKWSPVQNGGGDPSLQVVGIYTQVSNVVDETVSPPVTNAVPMCRIEYFGEATADVPVSVRAAETNEWSEVVKIDPVVTQEASTNVLTFTCETNLSHYAYWWFGVDKPAIIVTEEGIEIRSVSIGTRSVSFTWVCEEASASEFIIRKRQVGSSYWEEVGRVTATHGIERWTGKLFTVDKDCEWQIVTEIQEGGENE